MIPIHHMEAHALTARLTDPVQFPFMVMLISGGHCILAFAQEVNKFLILGTSTDTSPGVVLDKCARSLKLHDREGFREISGGQAMEKMGKNGNPLAFPFPEPLNASR